MPLHRRATKPFRIPISIHSWAPILDVSVCSVGPRSATTASEMGSIAGIKRSSPNTYGARVGSTGNTGPTGPGGETGPTGPSGLLGDITPGATISNPPGATISLSINGTGASPGYTSGGNQYTVLSLNAPTSIVLLDGNGAMTGKCLVITNLDESGNTLTIMDESNGDIAQLPGAGSFVAYYSGSSWNALLF